MGTASGGEGVVGIGIGIRGLKLRVLVTVVATIVRILSDGLAGTKYVRALRSCWHKGYHVVEVAPATVAKGTCEGELLFRQVSAAQDDATADRVLRTLT